MEWVSAVSGLNSHETHKRPQREEFLGADIFGAYRIAAILILCTDDNDKEDDDPDDIGTEECKLAFGMIAPKARHIIAWRGHDPSTHAHCHAYFCNPCPTKTMHERQRQRVQLRTRPTPKPLCKHSQFICIAILFDLVEFHPPS